MITKSMWKPIDESKKDGKPFLAILEGDDIPSVIKWEIYEEGVVDNGDIGYFTYVDENLVDLIQEVIPTHYVDYEMPN